MEIKQIIFDYDGVFTKDDYIPISKALSKSSGIPENQIEDRIGVHERKYVLSPDSTRFLKDIKKEFNSEKGLDELALLLNQRGNSGLYDEFHKFIKWKGKREGRGLSILSNQLAYRIQHIRAELDNNIGLEHFDRIWFSPEVGLQKPFVGVTHKDPNSAMDVSKVDIFPFAISQMGYLGYKPKECIFIDDSEKNIASAQASGMNGLIFKNVEQMIKELDKKFNVVIS